MSYFGSWKISDRSRRFVTIAIAILMILMLFLFWLHAHAAGKAPSFSFVTPGHAGTTGEVSGGAASSGDRDPIQTSDGADDEGSTGRGHPQVNTDTDNVCSANPDQADAQDEHGAPCAITEPEDGGSGQSIHSQSAFLNDGTGPFGSAHGGPGGSGGTHGGGAGSSGGNISGGGGASGGAGSGGSGGSGGAGGISSNSSGGPLNPGGSNGGSDPGGVSSSDPGPGGPVLGDTPGPGNGGPVQPGSDAEPFNPPSNGIPPIALLGPIPDPGSPPSGNGNPPGGDSTPPDGGLVPPTFGPPPFSLPPDSLNPPIILPDPILEPGPPLFPGGDGPSDGPPVVNGGHNVPEPNSLMLLLTGLAGFGFVRFFRRSPGIH